MPTVADDSSAPSSRYAGPPTPEAYRMLVDHAWRDLHHSRLQEWSALGIVAGAHFAIFQAVKLALDLVPSFGMPRAVALGAFFAGSFAVFGGLITMRHRRLMRVKLNWIFQAEDSLGLIKDKENPFGIIPREGPVLPVKWSGLSVPRLLSTSALMLGFYILLLLIDVGAIVAVIVVGSP